LIANDLDLIPSLLKTNEDYDLAELGAVDFSHRAACYHVSIDKPRRRDVMLLTEFNPVKAITLEFEGDAGRLHVPAEISKGHPAPLSSSACNSKRRQGRKEKWPGEAAVTSASLITVFVYLAFWIVSGFIDWFLETFQVFVAKCYFWWNAIDSTFRIGVRAQ
jgi:hypothetical protein